MSHRGYLFRSATIVFFFVAAFLVGAWLLFIVVICMMAMLRDECELE